MKSKLLLLLLIFILTNCTTSPENKIENIEPSKVSPILSTPTIEPTPTTPTTPSTELYLPKECMARDPNIDYENYNWRELKTIGGCSLMSTSPDERFTAYSTIVCLTESEPRICGEAIKLLERGKQDGAILYFFQPREKLMVSSMSWSSQNDLVFSMADINEERRTYVLGDFTSNPFDFSEKAYLYGGYVQWNESRTAFITQRFGQEGDCQFGIGGYDFSSQKRFPDIGLDPRIATDSISVVPIFPEGADRAWWDDSKIYLLIKPFETDYDNYIQRSLPQIAGMYKLTSEGPKFEILNRSPTEDFYFDFSNNEVEVKSKTFESRDLCNIDPF